MEPVETIRLATVYNSIKAQVYFLFLHKYKSRNSLLLRCKET